MFWFEQQTEQPLYAGNIGYCKVGLLVFDTCICVCFKSQFSFSWYLSRTRLVCKDVSLWSDYWILFNNHHFLKEISLGCLKGSFGVFECGPYFPMFCVDVAFFKLIQKWERTLQPQQHNRLPCNLYGQLCSISLRPLEVLICHWQAHIVNLSPTRHRWCFFFAEALVTISISMLNFVILGCYTTC